MSRATLTTALDLPFALEPAPGHQQSYPLPGVALVDLKIISIECFLIGFEIE